MSATYRPEPWVQTWTGQQFQILAPRAKDVNIFDIAQSLSQQCRYMGHTNLFYSVAQHSVLVSHYCAPEDALWGLLHDATEAYLSDIPKPLKETPVMAGYRELEDKLTHIIKEAFNLAELPKGKHMPDSVKEADVRMLFTEKRDLLQACDWGFDMVPYRNIIQPLGPTAARSLFLRRFYELTGVDPQKAENVVRLFESCDYNAAISVGCTAGRMAVDMLKDPEFMEELNKAVSAAR